MKVVVLFLNFSFIIYRGYFNVFCHQQSKQGAGSKQANETALDAAFAEYYQDEDSVPDTE